MNLSLPLTPQQHRLIRTHLALIPVYGWLVFVWTAYAIDISPTGRLDRSGHIKGHDFAHFYVLGEIARERATDDLYSFTAQAARMDRLVPNYQNRFLPIHAPQVALFFAPLAGLPYEKALVFWLTLSAITYAVSGWALWRALPNLRRFGWIVALLAVASPAFYALVTFGQTSAFALLWFTLGFLALRRGRPWLAGLALGTLFYKPTLVLVLPFAFLYARQFQVLLGAIVSALIQVTVVLAYFGKAAVIGYVHNFREAVASGTLLEARPELMHSLKAFFSILLPWPALALLCYAIAALIVFALAVRTWNTKAPLELRYAVLLLATVLMDPHVYTYELVVLVLPLMLLASWAVQRSQAISGLWIALACSYALPAFTVLVGLTGIQWSVVAFTGLTIIAVVSAESSPSLARGLR
jgi:hypothetical protein